MYRLPYAQFPNAIILEVGGRDAERYLQARLSNNTKALPVGKGCMAAALTPQGRTQALFAVYKLDGARTWLQCDGGERAGVIAAFKKYMVADRVEVRDLSQEMAVVHILNEDISSLLGQELPASAPLLAPTQFADGFVVARQRFLTPGWDVLGPRAWLEGLIDKAGMQALTPQQQLAQRIQAGIPSFPEELNEETLFSESGYREAVAFNKGCYVGQEVVERVDALGKTAKVLRRLKLKGEVQLPAGAQVNSSDGQPLGKVVSAAIDAGITYAFVLLKNDGSVAGTNVNCASLSGELL